MPKGEAGLFVEYCAKDFLDGTQMLDPWEELAYRRVCDLIYATNDRLTDDDRKLGWMTKTGRRWPAIKAVLTGGEKPKLLIVNGRITNIRCQEALGKAARKIAQYGGAGRASAETGKSLKNLKQHRTEVRNAVREERRTDGRTNHIPIEEKPSLSGGQKEARVALKALVPEDWWPDTAASAYAGEKAGWFGDRLGDEVESFRDHHRKNANKFADVPAAWRTWVRNGARFQRERGGAAPGIGEQRSAETDDAVLRAVLQEFITTRDDPSGRYRGRGYWPSNRGIPPGRPGCQVPDSLLAEFGLPPVKSWTPRNDHKSPQQRSLRRRRDQT